MTDLTAVDVLIDTDEQAIERARKINARLLTGLPEGWALDETHKPHITTLQRYVRPADLDKVYAAVESIIAETDMASLGYQAVKISNADWGFPGYGPTVLLVQVSPEVLAFQARLADAVAPFVESGGTAAAFVADPGEEISPTIIKWVEAYVPDQIGDGKYLPHLTVGAGKFEDLKIIEASFPCGRLPPWQQRHRTEAAQVLASVKVLTGTRRANGNRIEDQFCAGKINLDPRVPGPVGFSIDPADGSIPHA